MIEKNAIVRTNKLNVILIVRDNSIAKMNSIKDMFCAPFCVITPLGTGLYGFDSLSSLKSVAWFNALDAPFNKAKQMLAGITVKTIVKYEISIFPEYMRLAIITLLETMIGASNVNGLSNSIMPLNFLFIVPRRSICKNIFVVCQYINIISC